MLVIAGLLVTLLGAPVKCDGLAELIDDDDGHLHLASSATLKAASPCQSDPCVHGMCVDHANK